jgi:hypothetical protein
MNRSPTLSKSILDSIGDTPLVEVTELARARKLKGRLLVKCEYLNPGSSKKDRIAWEMIQEARAQGDLRPRQVVIELTSGNTGTGLATSQWTDRCLPRLRGNRGHVHRHHASSETDETRRPRIPGGTQRGRGAGGLCRHQS